MTKLNLPKNITFINQPLMQKWSCAKCKYRFSQLDLQAKNYQFLISEQANWLSLDGMITFSLKGIEHLTCPPPTIGECFIQESKFFY